MKKKTDRVRMGLKNKKTEIYKNIYKITIEYLFGDKNFRYHVFVISTGNT